MGNDFSPVAPVNTSFKWSLYGNLFPSRSSIFEKYPESGKLKMDTPAIVIGDATYNTGALDKVKTKDGARTFTARFKPGKGFALAVEHQRNDLTALLKVQHKEGCTAPQYVAGAQYTALRGDLKVNGKVNANTMQCKTSLLYKLPFSGRLALDSVTNLRDCLEGTGACKYNIGAAFDHALGSTGASYAGRQVTVHHFYKVNRGLVVGGELAVFNATTSHSWAALGVSYQVCSPVLAKLKVNAAGQASVAIRWKASRNALVTAGSLVDLSQPALPTFGFKVQVK